MTIKTDSIKIAIRTIRRTLEPPSNSRGGSADANGEPPLTGAKGLPPGVCVGLNENGINYD